MVRKIGANIKLINLILSSCLITACVTVNVNFPEGAVQKAATDYVNELYKAKQEDEKTSNKDTSAAPTRLPASFWASLLIPQAHAIEFQLNSPKVKEIQEKQKDRIGQIIEFKKLGAIGENNNGLLEVKDESKVTSKVDQLKMKKLVTSENSDRDDLYKEIIASNSLASEMESRIRQIFFEKFKDADPSGSFYKENGQWKSK